MRALIVTGLDLVKPDLADHLRFSQCQVECIKGGEDALDLARHCKFDVVVLNLNLPDMEGIDLIRRMRLACVDTPVLALSAAPHAAARIAALSAGADDAAALPADPAELHARLRALVRRTRGQSQPTLSVGSVSVNLETHEVTVQGAIVHLTGKETAIFEFLMLRQNLPISKETFVSYLYRRADHEPDPKIVDVFVCKLRRKLGAAGAPDLVETVWGQGYMVRSATGRQRSTEPNGLPTSSAALASTSLG